MHPLDSKKTTAHDAANGLFKNALRDATEIRCHTHKIADASILDAGIDTNGSLAAGLILARLCMGDLAEIQITACDNDTYASSNAVFVRTDDPLVACLGCQYAGWPIQTNDFFAMGSGPMRMARGREETLVMLNLTQAASSVVGVLESDKLPTRSAVETIAEQCGVSTSNLHLAIAPSTSIAGSVQVVARSIETAIHKLHELKFDVTQIVSATGHAPLPPPAKPGDTTTGIGRTNDAMLYGATVTLWIDADDGAIDGVASKVPSESSPDHGRPFADVFKEYDYDFYKVDPMLFSPAVVVIHNLRSGKTWRTGRLKTDVLIQSFT
ncbi:methenyltetrahydromethanopterin cyclohydrolase [Rubripirellula obstinata]|nr:methenyltetrahydromethanopterin cyclohydrolase [Rubripirellula obstinata]